MSIVMNEASTLRANVAVLNSQEPDAALLDAARRRDPEAFKELVTRYGRAFSGWRKRLPGTARMPRTFLRILLHRLSCTWTLFVGTPAFIPGSRALRSINRS